MPREIITVCVGQCGNQIGRSFWSRALHEHAANARYQQFSSGSHGPVHQGAVFEESMSTFFRNVNVSSKVELQAGSEISDLQARACLVDMESGVLSETMRGPLRSLFSSRQMLSDVSGAGNNWAHGYCEYGSKYATDLAELLRSQAEPCDSPQSFFLMHSLGGGTGSGLGSRILEIMEDEYHGIYRFAAAVLPSWSGEGDDVITSPYNSVSVGGFRRGCLVSTCVCICVCVCLRTTSASGTTFGPGSEALSPSLLLLEGCVSVLRFAGSRTPAAKPSSKIRSRCDRRLIVPTRNYGVCISCANTV